MVVTRKDLRRLELYMTSPIRNQCVMDSRFQIYIINQGSQSTAGSFLSIAYLYPEPNYWAGHGVQRAIVYDMYLVHIMVILIRSGGKEVTI